MINFEIAKNSCLKPNSIIQIVCRYYGVNDFDITKSTRKREVVTIRKYCCYLITKHCKRVTLLQTSKLLGYNTFGSHATVLFHYKDVIKKIPIYEDLRKEIENLEKAIREYVETSLLLEGYTILDAIYNPKILDRYRK